MRPSYASRGRGEPLNARSQGRPARGLSTIRGIPSGGAVRGATLGVMARKDDLGRAGEERAAAHLRECGYVILDRNWRCAEGELDIVAQRDDGIVAVEVKTRSGTAFGHPFEAVDDRKLRRLWRLAYAWRRAHPDASRGRRLRVDVVALVGPDPATARLEHVEGLW